MGQRIEVVLTCDLHEGEVPAEETLTFAVDGTTYAFELCAEHLSEFRDTLARYVGAAGPPTPPPPVGAPRAGPTWPRCGSGPAARATR